MGILDRIVKEIDKPEPPAWTKQIKTVNGFLELVHKHGESYYSRTTIEGERLVVIPMSGSAISPFNVVVNVDNPSRAYIMDTTQHRPVSIAEIEDNEVGEIPIGYSPATTSEIAALPDKVTDEIVDVTVSFKLTLEHMSNGPLMTATAILTPGDEVRCTAALSFNL